MKEKKRNIAQHNSVQYDTLTRKINELIISLFSFFRIPIVGSWISRIYLWRYMMFNVMLVGASGMILNFLLYEGIIRRIFVNFFGGIFLFFGMILSTLIIFFWNYFWNMKWSLNVNAQIYSMSMGDLLAFQEKIKRVLDSKFGAAAE